MAEELFDTQEKIDAATSAFVSLLDHPGWILICKILDGNIEVLKQQLEEGTGTEETKETIDNLRDKLKTYREVRNTPQTMLKKWDTSEEEVQDDDPYYRVPEPEVDNEQKSYYND